MTSGSSSEEESSPPLPRYSTLKVTVSREPTSYPTIWMILGSVILISNGPSLSNMTLNPPSNNKLKGIKTNLSSGLATE